MAAGFRSGDICLWETATLQLLGVLNGTPGRLHGLCFSPDGSRLAVGANDGTIRIWDLSDKQEVALLRGHESYVQRPDGSALASVSGDTTVRLWETSTRRERRAASVAAHTRTARGSGSCSSRLATAQRCCELAGRVVAVT